MNNNFKIILMCAGSFGAGAVAGVIGHKTYEKYKRKKYSGRYKFDEEINEVGNDGVSNETKTSDVQEKIKQFKEYVNSTSSEPLTPVPDEEIPEGVVISKIPKEEAPYQVSMNDIDVDMTDLLCFTQFRCGIVADDNFEPVNNIEAYIPEDILEFRKTEDDVVYTYSPMFNVYVELTYDDMLYEEFLNAHPLLRR